MSSAAVITGPPPSRAPEPGPPLDLWRLTPEQFRVLRERGILAEEAPVELRDGLLLARHPEDQPYPPVPVAPGAEPRPVWRLSVAQYHAMAETGILGEEDPVELLEGLLVRKMPKNPGHAIAVGLAQEALRMRLPPGWHVRAQDPVLLPEGEPEPDLAVVRGSLRDYVGRHPRAGDLLVEVADSSLMVDRTVKLRQYAAARVPVYWIVNLPEHILEVYSGPTGEGWTAAYAHRALIPEEGSVPLVLDGNEVGTVPVAELLP